jgi:hypothetical protein
MIGDSGLQFRINPAVVPSGSIDPALEISLKQLPRQVDLLKISATRNEKFRHSAAEDAFVRNDGVETVMSSARFISAIILVMILSAAHSAALVEMDMRLASLLPEDTAADSVVNQVGNYAVPSLSLEMLDSETMEKVADHMARYNGQLITRTDSLYGAGFFGVIGSDDATAGATRYLKYLSLSSMDFISYLSAQEDVIWETNENEMTSYYRSFANPGIYPIWGLKRARMGGGAFCLEFDIAEKFNEKRMIGLRPVKLESYLVEDEDNQSQPAWSLEMPTLEHGTTRYLFCDRYTSRVRRSIVDENGIALEVLIFDGIEGLYVEKHGLHKCTGLVFWRSLVSEEVWPPEVDYLGAAAYFPDLKLKLSLLPDIGLNDLREFTAFQPLLSASICSDNNRPEWLKLTDMGQIENWNNEGPIPNVIKDWFPDQ